MIISGNHYILDALGAVGVVLMSTVIVTAYTWWRQGGEPLGVVVRQLHGLRLPNSPYHTA